MLLAMDVEIEMCWWPDWDIGDRFGWHIVENIKLKSPTSLWPFQPVMSHNLWPATTWKPLNSVFQSVLKVPQWLFEMWRWTKIGKSYFHAKVNFDLVDEQMWRDFWYFLDFLEKKLVGTWGMITEFYQRVIIREILEEISMKMSHFSWF